VEQEQRQQRALLAGGQGDGTVVMDDLERT
jgi:hypothetical protein